MRKIYSSLLVLALMMVSIVAKAQYTVTITSDPENDYYSGDEGFNPDEIATALGLADTDALKELIEAGGAVYLKTDDGQSNAYTGNANEFWMNAAGVAQGYGDDGTCWYVGLSYDTDEESATSVVDIYMGQMPNFFKKVYENSVLKATLYLVNGEKQVSFDITLNVNAAEKSAIPDPTTSLAGLEIVKDYTLTLDFVEGKQYEGKTYSTTLDGVYEALGTTADEFDASVADYTYTQVVKVDSIEGEVQYSWEDRLVLPEDAAGGAWYGRYSNYDEATATEVTLPMNAPMVWGTGANTFYAQDITLADGEFSITSGQFPGTMKDGDEDYAYLYLIYGAKAARIKVIASVKKPETVDPNSMVKVGEATVEVSSPANTDYSTKAFSVDIEAIVAALGCEASDIDDFYAYAAEGEISDNHTTSGGGYYFNEEGYIDTWSNHAPVYIDASSLEDGEFEIGQYANVYIDITEDKVVTIPIIFQYGQNYYVVNVVYTVKAPKQGEEPVEYELVSTDGITMQMIPQDSYEWEATTQLDLDYIEGKIGTRDYKLYTDKWNASKETLEWSSNKTLTDGGGGFWFGSQEYENEEHQVVVDNAGWSSSCSFGIGITNAGVISWWQYPGARSVGDSYVANIYLVNEENGKYIKYVLQVLYVDEVRPEAETVLRVEKDAEVTEEGFGESGYFEYTLDTADLFEALGISDLSELEAATFYAAKSSTIFTPIELEELALFGADGYVVPETGNINSMAGFSLEGGLKVLFDPMELAFEKADESKAVVRLAIEYDGKRVVYTVTFLSEESPLAISAAAAQQTVAAGIYSISGARLAAPQKGVNIIRYANGEVKKVLVK